MAIDKNDVGRKWWIPNMCSEWNPADFNNRYLPDPNMTNAEISDWITGFVGFYVEARESRLMGQYEDEIESKLPCTYECRNFYEENMNEYYETISRDGSAFHDDPDNDFTKIRIRIAGRPNFYDDINNITPESLVKIEEINACMYGLDRSMWIPGTSNEITIKPLEVDARTGRTFGENKSNYRPNGSYYPYWSFGAQIQQRFALGLIPYVLETPVVRNGINIEEGEQHIFSIIVNNQFLYYYSGSLEDFDYNNLPSLGSLMRTFDDMNGITIFDDNYYNVLDTHTMFDFESAQFVRDYFSVPGRAEDYRASVINWWNMKESSVINPLSTINEKNSLYHCPCDPSDFSCISNNCQQPWLSTEKLEKRRTINESLNTKLEILKSNLDSNIIKIYGDGENKLDFISKVTDIINRLTPGTISASDTNQVLNTVENVILDSRAESDVTTHHGNIYGGKISVTYDSTPDGEVSSQENLVWEIPIDNKVNLDDLFPIFIGYRRVGNIKDLPEFGGVYHGKIMSNRYYSPPLAELNEISQFQQNRNSRIKEVRIRR